MKRKWGDSLSIMKSSSAIVIALFIICAVQSCDGVRRIAQRRRDSPAELPASYLPTPSMETLSELAAAMGAAGFEHHTEGKTLVKRLIPQKSEPDLDAVEHHGVIGKPGVDFPAFPSIPKTGFNCKNVPTGYYADLETDCQVFHICDTSRKISFLCPNGTIFSQSHLICDWWFKVDCASAPALYESSAEYYSNEQKKTQKFTQSLSKTTDLQQINSDTNVRAEKTLQRRPTTKDTPVPSTTERLFKHRQRLQSSQPDITPLANARATSRSFQALYSDTNFKPQQSLIPAGFEKRRSSLVQLIGNNFGNSATARTTLPTYTDAATYRTVAPDFGGLKEMQVAAETASFTNNNNRQFLQDYNKNYRPYPVYTPNLAAREGKTKSPTLTTLFVHDIRTPEQTKPQTEAPKIYTEATTKRPTLFPYTKSYVNTVTAKREPYTRPGVSLLKDYLERERNKSIAASTTEKVARATDRFDDFSPRTGFETATKLPYTTKDDSYFSDTASSDRYNVFSSTNSANQVSTEPTYQERRERLMRKLNLNIFPTEPTLPTTGAEQYGKRPGLVVPPSLTPKTLHSLAIYYATALDNLSTTAPPEDKVETTTSAIDEFENVDENFPALFSRHTINKYSKLFAKGMQNSNLLEEIKLDPNGTYNDLNEDLDLMVQQSQNPIATNPQIRELAQVFTHALSAYLQDPVQFRKVLSDIRPTHPSFTEPITTTDEITTEGPTTTVNEEDDEILGFSDENKARPALAQLRESKLLSPTVYSRFAEGETTTANYIDTESVSSTIQPISSTTLRSIFRCCGRISASYTTAATPRELSSTASSYSNTVAYSVNTLANNYTESEISTTENSYIPKYAGFQNNTFNPYGTGISPTAGKLINDYTENTNLPTAWGVDAAVTATEATVKNADLNSFESKKIRPTTYSPSTTTQVYFTEADSIELENEEELQRAHSQSFVSPQDNTITRQGKNINFEDSANLIRKPSEELEAPTVSDQSEITTLQTTTAQQTTTNKIDDGDALTTVSPDEVNIFTSSDAEKSTDQFQWSSGYDNWHSTVILDPITVNDGLSSNGADQQSLSQLASQTTGWANNNFINTATTAPSYDYTGTSEQAVSSSQFIERTTPTADVEIENRNGKLLRLPTSTESNQDLTTIAETVVEKAKEIMGEMNATTTEKLMNVMKKTKSKTVRRLILLLVQTCDDDHNSTAEASKRALLEALMAVSQKDMDEIAKEQETTEVPITESDFEARSTNTYRRTDRVSEAQDLKQPKQRGSQRTGKSLNFDASAINSLSHPVTTETIYKTDAIAEATASNTTPSPFTRTTPTIRRGVKKFNSRPSTVETRVTKAPITTVDTPIAEAQVAPSGSDLKPGSDTRALELLRSLYTIAARWG